MWKRTISVLAIALLALSVMAVALADNGSGDDGLQVQATAELGDNGSGAGVQAQGGMPPMPPIRERLAEREQQLEQRREELQNRTEQARERLNQTRAELQNRVEQARERLNQTRTQIQDRLEQARQRFEQAKEQAQQRYEQARERYQEQHQKVNQARQQFIECKSDNSTECQAVRNTVRQNAQPFLTSSADLVLDALNRVEIQVNASTELDNATKADLLAQLDQKIADVNDAKAVIANLDNSSTPDDIRAAAKTIREAWLSTKTVLKTSVGRLINARLGNIIHQVEQLSTRIHATRDRLAAAGKDVTALDAKMDEFDAKLADAKSEYQAAVDLYKNAAPGKIDEIAQEAHDHVKNAQDDLKAVRDSLRDIVNEIRQQNGGGLEIEDNGTNATQGENESNESAGEDVNLSVNASANVTANVTA